LRFATQAVEIWAIKMHWLAKALRMRQDVLRRIAEGFLSLQTAVPEEHGDHFKPISVHQIAKATYLHETTVKRAVANKVIAIGGQRIQFDNLVT
jgi:RNA polymerase sigma-54 factor